MTRSNSVFSRRNHNTEWQVAVLAKLDSMTKLQDEFRKELAEHSAESRLTPSGLLRAGLFLMLMVALIAGSVIATIISPTFQSQASDASSQAQAAAVQAANDMRPVLAFTEKHGAKYFYAHATKALIADVQNANAAYNQADADIAQVKYYTARSTEFLYWGQIALAVSSACFGAVAGYLLLPVLTGSRKRRRGQDGAKPLRAAGPREGRT